MGLQTRLKLKAKEPPRDAMGHVVPNSLADVFRGRGLMAEWCFHLDDLRLQLHKFAKQEYGSDLNIPFIEQQIETLRAHVMIAAPMRECDCPAEERLCPKCEGARWLSGAGAARARNTLPSS